MSKRFWAAPFVAVAMAFAAVGAGGCSSGDDSAPPVPMNAPGSTAYNDDIHCKTDADCQAAESCTNGLCQMKRCAANGIDGTAPPLGVHGFMKLNREVLLASGSNVVGYSSTGSNLARVGGTSSWAAGGTLVDVAGGNILQTRPEGFVTATSGSSSLKITQNNRQVGTINVGFTPVAVTTGDVNGEGLDRVIAASSDGNFAICNAKDQSCDKFNLGLTGVRDVAAGDIDADGFDEVLFLIADKIVIYNHDGGHTKQDRTITSGTGRNLVRIAAGDIDGDGYDEVIGLEEGTDTDTLNVFAFADNSFNIRSTTNIDAGTQDVAVSGIGRQAKDVVAIGQGNQVAVYDGKPDGTLANAFTTSLTSASNVTRVALADVTGDNVPANLLGAAKVASGSVIPLAVLVPPPYSKQYSGEGHGDSRSVVTLGSSATSGTGSDESVTLSYGYGVSFGHSLGPIFSFNVGYSINKSLTTTKSVSHSKTVSQSFSFEARPDLDGYETGAVAVGCGCYNQFDYQIDDPNKVMGPDGGDGKISVFIPIGGQTTVWALKRYNQLAQALGDGSLPPITVGIKSGDLSSYPATAQRLDGTPIPKEDNLFPESPPFRVSDVASTSFALTLSDAQTTATNTSSGWNVNGSVGIFGLSVNGNVGVTQSNGYHVDIAKSTTFSGSVPPLRDNPSTPEDEFAINAYSFTPIVYASHYETPQKKDAEYWVVTYTVGKNNN